jgi:hypothetical protein
MGPDCGLEMEGRTSYSGTGAWAPVLSKEDACTAADTRAGVGAPMSAKESGRAASGVCVVAPASEEQGGRAASGVGAHGPSVRTTPGKPATGTEGVEDPVGTCTSKFTTGNKVIVEA